MKKIIVIGLVTIITLVCYAQDNFKAGIIYGDNHAFGLTAPDNWLLDNQSGVNQGLHAVFYEEGFTWANAITVMYANAASLEDSTHSTLNALIEYDLNNFKSQYSDLIIKDQNPIKINEKTTAIVKHLSGDSYGNFEAIAYIDAGNTGIMIIMSSRTKEGFNKSLNAFEELVKSYIFIADKVITKEK